MSARTRFLKILSFENCHSVPFIASSFASVTSLQETKLCRQSSLPATTEWIFTSRLKESSFATAIAFSPTRHQINITSSWTKLTQIHELRPELCTTRTSLLSSLLPSIEAFKIFYSSFSLQFFFDEKTARKNHLYIIQCDDVLSGDIKISRVMALLSMIAVIFPVPDFWRWPQISSI